jgi:hypothetical protein
VLRPSELEPVAAGDPELVVLTAAPLPEGPSPWVLELGDAARRAEFRSELQAARGHHLRAWSSRRAGARARRQLVRALLEVKAAEEPADGCEQLSLDFEQAPPQAVVAELEGASALPPPDLPAPLPDEPLAAEDDLQPALLDRIAAYTLSSR